MTPHDELMALAGRLDAAELHYIGSAVVCYGVDAEEVRQAVNDLRALLDSDAFRAMVRDAKRVSPPIKVVGSHDGKSVLHVEWDGHSEPRADISGWSFEGIGVLPTQHDVLAAVLRWIHDNAWQDTTLIQAIDAAASGAGEQA